VCFLLDVVTPAPVLSRHDPPAPILPVKLLRTLLALGDGTMRPAQEALPRDPHSVSDSGIRNSCPQSLASFPSGQLCYTPSQPTGSFPRCISQRLSIIQHTYESAAVTVPACVRYVTLNTFATRSVVNSGENILMCLFQTGQFTNT